jgi:hypothetical protein
MTRIKIVSILCAFLLVSNAILLVLFFKKPPHYHGPKQQIIERLGFDKAQIKAYEKTIFVHRFQIHSTEREIVKLKNKLYKELNLNENQKIQDSLIHELGKKQEEIEQIHFSHFLKIKGLCTKPGQLKEFEKLTHELGRLFDKKPPHPKKP